MGVKSWRPSSCDDDAVNELRIACLSDTHLRHGNALPSWCLRRLEGADLIVHAGDLTTPPVLESLARLAPVAAVRGNMDALALKEILPERRIAEIGEVKIGIVHDAGPALGRSRRLAQLFPDCDVVVFGHTHVPWIQRLSERLIVNPGSPTAPRSGLGTMLELGIASGGRVDPSMVFATT
jgi:putative phosphoesterase